MNFQFAHKDKLETENSRKSQISNFYTEVDQLKQNVKLCNGNKAKRDLRT